MHLFDHQPHEKLSQSSTKWITYGGKIHLNRQLLGILYSLNVFKG